MKNNRKNRALIKIMIKNHVSLHRPSVIIKDLKMMVKQIILNPTDIVIVFKGVTPSGNFTIWPIKPQSKICKFFNSIYVK